MSFKFLCLFFKSTVNSVDPKCMGHFENNLVLGDSHEGMQKVRDVFVFIYSMLSFLIFKRDKVEY